MPDAAVIEPICATVGNQAILLMTAVQYGTAKLSEYKALTATLAFYATHAPRRLRHDLTAAAGAIMSSENALLHSSPEVAGTTLQNEFNVIANTDCSGYGQPFNPPSGIVPAAP